MFCVRLRESENRRRERRRFQKKGRHFGIKSEGKIVVSFNENEGYDATRVQPHSNTFARRREFVRPNTVQGWCKNEEYSNARSGIVIVAVLLLLVLLFTTAKLLSYATVYSSLYVEEGGAGPDGALGGGGRGGGGAPEGA